MEKTFGILVYLKKSKSNKKGESPIVGRITVNGEREEISLKLKIEDERWDSDKGVVKGAKSDAKIINEGIVNFKNKIQKIYNDLIRNDEYIDSKIIKNIYQGGDLRSKTIMFHFNKTMKIIEERIGIDYSKETLKNYRTTKKHLQSYINHKYHRDDKPIIGIKMDFIRDFEHYLKATAKLSQSSTVKFHKVVYDSFFENDSWRNQLELPQTIEHK